MLAQEGSLANLSDVLDDLSADRTFAPSFVESGLLGSEALLVMLALVGLKMLATSITLGSGGSGGVFAPSLFIGSMLGGCLGLTFALLFPGIPGPPGAYALVGMDTTISRLKFEIRGKNNTLIPLRGHSIVFSLVFQPPGE